MLGLTVWQFVFFIAVAIITTLAVVGTITTRKPYWLLLLIVSAVFLVLGFGPHWDWNPPLWLSPEVAAAPATTPISEKIVVETVVVEKLIEVEKTEAEPTATITPTETPAPEQCADLGKWTDFSVMSNMDVGDPSLTSIIYADNGGAQFVAIVEKSFNLDFEASSLTGKFLQSNVGMSDIICVADALAKEANTNVKFYIGSGMTPLGWTKEYPDGWTMFTWTYQQTKIEVPGTTWQDKVVSLVGGSHEYGSKNSVTYCQLWNGSDASLVYHMIIEAGKTLSSPPMQGTCWAVTGGDREILYSRFTQMTDEVFLRDTHPSIMKIYVGKAENAPTGWSTTLPTGWSK